MKRFLYGFMYVCVFVFLSGCLKTVKEIDYKKVDEVGRFQI